MTPPRRIARCLLPVACCLFAVGLSSCTENSLIAPLPDAGVTKRRVKPRDDVRAYPPHAIRSDGVGPYYLDAPLSDVLHSLPDGPRVELLQVGSVADWRVVRDSEQLLIGADDSNRVAFIVVLGPEIARTEGELRVGVSLAELQAALGPAVDGGDAARDREIYESARLPGVRFVTDAPVGTPPADARVVAVVLTRREAARAEAKPAPDGGVPETPPPDRSGVRAVCRSGGGLAAARAEVVAAARGRASTRPIADGGATVRFGCVTSAAPDALVTVGGELVVVSGERGKLRRAFALPLPDGAFAAPVDVDGDGRDEIAVGIQEADRRQRSLEIRLYRWEAGRLSLALSERPFVVTAAEAGGAGVTPLAVDFWVELAAARGALTVGGLYSARTFTGVRVFAPVRPVELRVEPRRVVAAVPIDAGVPEEVRRGRDAGVEEPR